MDVYGFILMLHDTYIRPGVAGKNGSGARINSVAVPHHPKTTPTVPPSPRPESEGVRTHVDRPPHPPPPTCASFISALNMNPSHVLLCVSSSTKDQIVMVNGVSMENVHSNYTIQILKTCGKTANVVSTGETLALGPGAAAAA